jgi:hypothetical protein
MHETKTTSVATFYARRHAPDLPLELPHLVATGPGDRTRALERETVVERVEPFDTMNPADSAEPINDILPHGRHPFLKRKTVVAVDFIRDEAIAKKAQAADRTSLGRLLRLRRTSH